MKVNVTYFDPKLLLGIARYFFPKKKLNEHKLNSLNSTLVPRLYKETLIINVKNEAKKYQPGGSEGEKVVENFYCLPYHKNIENRFLNKA